MSPCIENRTDLRQKKNLYNTEVIQLQIEIKVNEGKVGIYLKYGALMDDTTGPGMHTMAPFVTEVRKSPQVYRVTIQVVTNLPLTSK